MSDFAVTIGVCTYSQVKTKAVLRHFILEQCPNPKISVQYQDGDALIGRSRSIVANNFLNKTKDEFLMFLDEDIVIDPLDATQMLFDAYTLNLDITGAAYCTKSKKNPGFAIRPLSSGRITFGKSGGLNEMRSISTGCMIIRRRVFEKMIESEKIHFCKHGDKGYYPFFQDKEMLIDGQWEHISEDWFFTEIARELGFKVWVDTRVKLGHLGEYEFNWDDILETNNGHRKSYDSVNFKIGNSKEEDLLRVLPYAIPSSRVSGFREDLKKLVGIK